MSDASPTYGRITKAVFDVPEHILQEFPWQMSRSGAEIGASVPKAGAPSDNVILLASGAWSLASYQKTNLSYVSERTEGAAAVIDSAQWTTSSTVKNFNNQRKDGDLTGSSFDTNVRTSSDEFLVLRVPSGTGFDTHLSADQAAYPSPVYQTQNAPMDRHGISNTIFNANQTFVWRYTVSGNRKQGLDLIANFFFGSPSGADNSGAFCVGVNGNGYLVLWEKVNGTWKGRGTWEGSAAHLTADGAHEIFIYPHLSYDGKIGYIEFTSQINGKSAQNGSGLVSSYTTKPQSANKFLYSCKMTSIDGSGALVPRTAVSGTGPARFDFRRGTRPQVQVSKMMFYPTGHLVDGPFIVAGFPSSLANIYVEWSASVPTGTSMTVELVDGETGVAITPTTVTSTYAIFPPNYLQNLYFVRFTFNASSDQFTSPLLWSYNVVRGGIYSTTGTTPFSADVRDVTITGQEYDPSHERANFVIKDPTNSLSIFLKRSNIPTQIRSYYDPNDRTKYSTLMQGYSPHIAAHKRGKVGRTYPSPEWRNYDIETVGTWQRLHESLFMGRYNLTEDLTARDQVNNVALPLKVTDVLRTLFQYAGYPLGDIDVPDAEFRFFPIPGESAKFMIEPLTNLAEFIMDAAKKYLGWFIWFDANSGTNGMWRLVPPPHAPYTNNLATFHFKPTSGGLKPVLHPGAYGNSGSYPNYVAPIGSGAQVHAPVIARNGESTWKSWVKPPEGNMVIVSGTGELTYDSQNKKQVYSMAFNPVSHNFGVLSDGTIVQTADPTSPDYIGRCVPIFIIDPLIGTKENADWVCRRVYDISCHGVKMAQFEAPLVLVSDPLDGYQTRPRPLKYYDQVLVYNNDGTPVQYLVRNCNPTYTKDNVQMAIYELESPRF